MLNQCEFEVNKPPRTVGRHQSIIINVNDDDHNRIRYVQYRLQSTLSSPEIYSLPTWQL